ncbi:hypothetical protein Poli38472_003522 [Pythium oligandrum]|uniref:MYND-type domain-containing protein n=1 Tax=Pythium oligandrum TaxID=41045 RepID=A0A8K1C7U0_PYTOL|nr:hypothetical protein Poli38472_003522 [Pythium oligandrum]|eukprot:TMW57597.1 hypothetical protein Poli38472_003522 [Pythium oligandrum]
MELRECVACGTTADDAQKLMRCSQCKWAAYCSRECQQSDWKQRHQAMCTSLKIGLAFREAEREFWASRPAEELEAFIRDESLDPTAMARRYYGEVLFCLTGLKPLVLFSNLPAGWRTSFAADVLGKCGLLQPPHDSLPSCQPRIYSVGDKVETVVEYELSGTLVLVNEAHPIVSGAHKSLRLAPVSLSEDATTLLVSHAPQSTASILQEAELARYVDYPIALDECHDPMIEVGYFLQRPDGARELLTSYCASNRATHHARLRAHFDRYRAPFHAMLNLVVDIASV